MRRPCSAVVICEPTDIPRRTPRRLARRLVLLEVAQHPSRAGAMVASTWSGDRNAFPSLEFVLLHARHRHSMAADIAWHEAAGMPYGGVYHGGDAVAQNVFGPISQDVVGFAVTAEEFIASGEFGF